MESGGKVTLVLGASTNPDRVSWDAVVSLASRNVPVIAVGRREYNGDNFKIRREIPSGLKKVHTVSLYLGEANQHEYYDQILSLKPQRIIFNPGTWNPELAEMATIEGIEVVEGCMLNMLTNGEF
jgi:hypothetical protein